MAGILLIVWALLLPLVSWAATQEFPAQARVSVAVADLRSEPVQRAETLEHDPLQESQLLYGDPVTVLEIRGDWARVSADAQQEWTHNRRWEGYPGWMRVSDLMPEPAGWKPEPAPALAGAPSTLRKQIVQAARGFLGTPYLWGGRSRQAVDCSGLVGLAYQACGLSIPRDAHEQWMKARGVAREELQPADLVFLSDHENPDRITHVMLYAGNGKVIEGPGTGERVREISLEERLKEAAGRRVSYGSYLK